MSGLPPPGIVQVATTLRVAKSITETLPWPFRDAGEAVGAAIGDIELRAVAARIEPVRADAGLDEVESRSNESPSITITPVPDQVGDEEGRAVGRDADVLRDMAGATTAASRRACDGRDRSWRARRCIRR